MEERPPVVQLQFEEKPLQGFSPVVLHKPARRTAVTNAGDYRLYLGGGAINRALADLLKEEQGLCFGKRSQPYADMHLALLAASRNAQGELVDAASVLPETERLLSSLCLSAAFAMAGVALEGDAPGCEAATGAVFLDVFALDKQPVAEGNAAMLYVVGPKGEGCTGPKSKDSGPLLGKSRFLAEIEALGKRALDVVAKYNQLHVGAAIEEVRWCLVSGGVYCHKDATKGEVAAATMKGMLQSEATVLVTFTYDDDVFRLAHEGKTDDDASQMSDSTPDVAVLNPGNVSWWGNDGWSSWRNDASWWNDASWSNDATWDAWKEESTQQPQNQWARNESMELSTRSSYYQ